MSTLSGPNTRLPRSSCSTLLLLQPTKQTTMSPLTLLTATVVVLGLGCWVPTGAVFNARMAACNRSAMPVVDDLSLNDYAGRWYHSHLSTDGSINYRVSGVALDLHVTVPLAADRRGQVNQDFIAGRNTFTDRSGNCYHSEWLDEVIDDKQSESYNVQFLQKPVAGYYVYWYDTYVLATDYTSTAVLLSEKNFNGNTNITYAYIKVYVRNATVAPDADVVDAALNGFCQGDALDLSSDFYYQIPNDSDAPCFAPPAKKMPV